MEFKMEVPIQVAVRTFPCYPNELCCVETHQKHIDIKQLDALVSNGCQPNNNINESCGLVQVIQPHLNKDNNGNAVDNEKTSFKIRHALPYGCSQEFIYRTSVQPMIRNFLEGYDVSIVTYGQSCTGKTYCMYGPGFDGVYSELEQGIVPRAICDIFTQLTKRPNGCRFSVNVAWIDLCGNEIRDILGDGIVHCQNLNDVFQCLRIGFTNRNPQLAHSIFTITIEQQWISPDGLLQHRLSTASFCDLIGTQRMATINQFNEPIGLSKDPGLQVLERIVTSLCASNTLENDRNSIMNQYEETMLTRLLKDSFGGRAQTIMICCVSPLEQDIFETIENLHFAYKAQFVRNAVLLNTFSDNNMPIGNYIDPVVIQDLHISKFSHYHPAYVMNKLNTENTQNPPATEFATTQWLKLISNAEGLFNKLLINNKTLNEDDRECIEEWMYLKQECESFGSAGLISNPRLLKPIQETDENSDNDNECNIEALEQEKTDISGQNATYSDNESDDDENLELLDAKVSDLMTIFSCKVKEITEEKYHDFIETYPNAVLNSCDDNGKKMVKMKKAIVPAETSEVNGNHRRRSIQTCESSGLSRSDIDHLSRIAEESMRNSQQVSLTNTVCREATSFLENSDDMHPLRIANLHKSEVVVFNSIRRVRNDIEAKEKEITELERNIKLIDELMESTGERMKAKRDLNRKVTILQTEKEHCKKMITNSRDKKEMEKLRMDLKEIEKELKEKSRLKEISRDSDNTIKEYQQHVQERRKQLNALKKALKTDRKLLKELEGKLKIEKLKNAKEEKKSTACMNVDTRITQLDCVLKEKNEYLHRNNDESEIVESIRHEIRNLRSQRDRLTDAQCILNQKLKKERLTDWEARKILEYDVAKEVIDHAMEMKNQLICGRDVSSRKFVGNPDLMGQLSKLNEKEMRVLLYKCFQKIVDLRESSRQLEVQLLMIEQERTEWELRERALYDKFQQSRLEDERYTLDLQKQYQSILTKLFQKASEDCETSPNIPSDAILLRTPSNLLHSDNRHHHTISNEIGFNIHDYEYNRGRSRQQQHSYRFANTAMATTSKRNTTEPIDLYQKQKQKMSLLKLFSSNGLKRNMHQQLMLTNHANQPTAAATEGKVTVVKKKIIIQQNKP